MTESLKHSNESLPAWGAIPLAGGRARFRIWAPGQDRLALRAAGRDRPMTAEADGWFQIVTDDVVPGAEYSFVLEDGRSLPDPASRRQAGDVHGPSILQAAASAGLGQWRGRPWSQAVIYELHVGTFTPEGTFDAARARLGYLADLGITAVEIMPVAQFGGDRGWGYDGVLPYAPHPAYGSPEALRALVRTAHEHGLMVLLDVVYNHFGPEGNYLPVLAPAFFDRERETPWGAGIDYGQPAVRRFFIDNAVYWLTEFGFDGLRLDAVDQIADPSDPELLIELAREIRARITERPIHLTTEDHRNVTHLHERGPDGSVPLHTAEWNDDFHNAAHVIATGETEGYYRVFDSDRWRLFARSLAEGFAFQGEAEIDNGRGAPSTHLPPTAFVDFLQNHDQTGNRALGERLIALAEPAMVDALSAILLLSPHIPLIFMGEEYGETRPFTFFAGFDGDLGEAVRQGRRSEFAAFAGFDKASVPDPINPATFHNAKLDWAHAQSDEGRRHHGRVRVLLDLRRTYLWPLLEGAGGQCGKVLCADEGAIAVDWQLGPARLALRANLSPAQRGLPAAEGRMIHATGAGPGAPFSAFHFLHHPSDATR